MLRYRSKSPPTKREEGVLLMARAVSSLHDPVSVADLACATAAWAARHLDGRVSWHATSQHAAELATVFVGAFKDGAFTADRVRPIAWWFTPFSTPWPG
jgi:hypothetical protein